MITLPVVENFHSIQGEGDWVGTPMHFIRLAGCTVGVHASTRDKYAICTSITGSKFTCDTDYRKGRKCSVNGLLAETYERHICLTGGEPLLHSAVCGFIALAHQIEVRVHIETSGTVPFSTELTRFNPWIACSPKAGALDRSILDSDEIRLLVDEDFKLDTLPASILNHHNVFVSPINRVQSPIWGMWISEENLKPALEVLEKRPDWRLSVQLHKYLGLR